MDHTIRSHHTVLRSRRKVKFQSQTSSIQETVENQEDISSESMASSMDSGIKHGNSKFSQQNQPQHTHGVESNEEQNMLNDGVRLGLGDIQELNVFVPEGMSTSFTLLRKGKVPPKVDVLIWFLIHGRVCTKDLLVRRYLLLLEKSICPFLMNP